jgi:2-iminobutanoate/2-iminopropanoate deaminase
MPGACEVIRPYTPAVRAGDWLVVSGQVGIVDGKLVPGGLEPELRQAISNLRGQLETNGAALTNVVKTTVFLRHMSDYALMNEVYMQELGEHRPARSAIGVAELPLGALVEVEAWAWMG